MHDIEQKPIPWSLKIAPENSSVISRWEQGTHFIVSSIKHNVDLKASFEAKCMSWLGKASNWLRGQIHYCIALSKLFPKPGVIYS